MKLHVTIESQTYEVEVDVVDPNASLASADLRVQSAPVVAPPKAPAGRMLVPGMNGSGNGSNPPPNPQPTPNAQPTLVTTEAPPVLARPPEPPLPPKPAWHGLGVGAPGEVCSPIPGIITNVNVKVGDAVKAYDSIVVIEIARKYVSDDRPMTGTVRALVGGTVKELLVQKGDAVEAGRVLARIG
ncbi:MAG: biotin/lipoyl-containing protein [Phycisphaerales bacterium]